MDRSDRELILSLHGIGTPPSHVPGDERPYWMPTAVFGEFAATADAAAKRLGVQLVLTFDDGNRSDLDIAAPVLTRHGLRGLFFPCVGRFDRPEHLGPAALRELSAAGFEIGSHGVDHVKWNQLGDADLNREVAGSKAILEDVLGAEVRSAAIPFGAYSRRVLRALRSAGYRTVYSSDRGFSQAGAWFRRRWPYHAQEPFDLAHMVAVSASLGHRMLGSAKSIVKSLR